MGCVISDQTKDNVKLSSLDRYERQDLIGVGHHGRVYKCFYHLDKNDYAMKIIDQFPTHRDVKSLQTPCAVLTDKLKKLRHDKIVTYYQILFCEREISVVMNLAKEGTLKTYIHKKGALPQQKMANLIRKILEGLVYLHNAGILHKDLKTSNVLMMSKEEIKLSDYGLAEIYDERLTSQGKGKQQNVSSLRCESLPYMAPQVIKNLQITDKSDVWSVGCILIQLITSQTPWPELLSSFEDTFLRLSEGAYPPFPTNISRECRSFLESCLAVVPSQRLSVKQLLTHKFICIHSNSEQVLDGNESIESVHFDNEAIDNNHQKKVMQENNNHSNTAVGRIPSPKEKQLQVSEPLQAGKSIKIDEMFFRIQDDLQQMEDSSSLNKKEALKRQQIISKMRNLKDRTVMLNNKQIKLQPSLYKNSHTNRIVTQQTEWTTPPRYERNASQMGDSYDGRINGIQDRNRIKSSNPTTHDSIDNQLRIHHFRTETQPSMMDSHQDNQYFKKPLKLLKQKIKQNKKLADFNSRLSNESKLDEVTHTEIQNHEKSIFDEVEQQMRSRTETRREEIIIDTVLARAERDRYITEQRFMKKQRQVQKHKWECELKKGAELLTQQLPHRYYYNKNYTAIRQ